MRHNAAVKPERVSRAIGLNGWLGADLYSKAHLCRNESPQKETEEWLDHYRSYHSPLPLLRHPQLHDESASQSLLAPRHRRRPAGATCHHGPTALRMRRSSCAASHLLFGFRARSTIMPLRPRLSRTRSPMASARIFRSLTVELSGAYADV